MLAADPHCWYCGTEVVEVGHHQRRSWEPKTSVPANAATIEHKFHRLKGDRPALGALVLACGECNNERNGYSQQLAGVDHLRRRARQHPCACGCGELARSDFAYKRGHGDDTLRVVS